MTPSVELKTEGQSVKLKVLNCRTVYANISSPRLDKNGTPIEYSCCFLVPKGAQGIDSVKDEIRKLAVARFGGPGWKLPLIKDGDKVYEEFVEKGGDPADRIKNAMRGHYIISANSKLRDKGTSQLVQVKSAGTIYSGCYASAAIEVKPYDFTGEDGVAKGVKGYLNGVVFKGDGEVLGHSELNLEAELGAAAQSTVAPARTVDLDDESLPF
jgi:hypothetical protein